MILLDKEPGVRVAINSSLPEGLPSSIVQSQIPDVFNKTYIKELRGFLDPNIKLSPEIGRNRFFSKLSSGINKIKNSLDVLKYTRVRGRGPCQGCISGTEDNHHGGSKCRKRGTMSFNYKSLAVNIFRSFSVSSGLR